MGASQWVIAAGVASALAAIATAIATVVLVRVTTKYVRTSAEMLAEMKRSRDLAMQPLLTATLDPAPGPPSHILKSITVRNLGNAPALGVLFDMSLEAGGKCYGELDYSVRDLGIGEEIPIPGDPLYDPNEGTRLLKVAAQVEDKNSPLTASIWLRYNNILHVEFERAFTMVYEKDSLPPWQLAEERTKVTPWDPQRRAAGESDDKVGVPLKRSPSGVSSG